MIKNRLLPFRMLPASWGLSGDAFAIAEAHYRFDGEDLDRCLIGIHHKDDPKGLARATLEVDLRYHRIDAYNHAHRVAELEISDPDKLQLRKIDIDLAHERLSPYEAARQKATIQTRSGRERDLRLLQVDHEFKHIDRHTYDKQRAILCDEPWIAIINSGFDPTKGVDGVFFEFDWNAQWIAFLKKNGYEGVTDEQVVDDWFTDVCRSHSAAELAGSMMPSRNLHLSE